MVGLGLKPGAAEWKVQTNPLSYGGTPIFAKFFLNGRTPAYFSFVFGLFKQTIQILHQINVKNVHPVYGAEIQTHNLSNMSRCP